MIKVDIEIQGLNALLEDLKEFPKELARARRNAANTTATAVEKVGFEEASKEFNIQKARLKRDSRGRDTTYIQRARAGEEQAIITFKGGDSPKAGDRPGLQHFAVGPQENPSVIRSHSARGMSWRRNDKGQMELNRADGPKFKIRRGGPTETVERGFYGVGKLKGQGIFQRRETGRKIIRRTGPSIKQMVEDSKVLKQVEEKGRTILMQKMIEAVDKQLSKKR